MIDLVLENDKELEKIMARKLKNMQKKMEETRKIEEIRSKEQQIDKRSILKNRLHDRGLEVLEIAERAYPNETKQIVEKLAQLIIERKINGYISGGELLELFRSLGMNIRVNTSISVQKGGKLIPLSEKLKGEKE